MNVEDLPRKDPVRCECPEHHCTNTVGVGELDDVVITPRLCTPCLFGCMP